MALLCLFAAGALLWATGAQAVDSNCLSGGSGNWTTITWVNCEGNPGGDPDSDDTVTILQEHAVTLNTTTSIANLVICDTVCETDTSLTHSGASALTVSGTVTVHGGNADTDNGLWAIAGGTATVTGSISFNPQATTPGEDAKITISTGTLNANGGIAFENNAGAVDNQILAITSTGTVNLKGSISNLSSADIDPGTTSTFVYNDTSAQTIVFDSTNSTYAKLTINNTNASGATLGEAITTTNVTDNVTVGDDSVSAVFNNGGYAITGTSGKTFLVNNNATFIMSGTAAYPTGFSTFTFDSNSTVKYLQTSSATVVAATYGNLGIGDVSDTNAGVTYTLGGTTTVAGSLTIGNASSTNSDTLDQGATYNLTTGAVTVTSKGIWTNTGTGDVTLSGNVSNAGTITLDGSGEGCGGADAITLTSTTTDNRTWSGAGTFTLYDLTVSEMSHATGITAYSSTDGGGGGTNVNWTISGSCLGGGGGGESTDMVVGDSVWGDTTFK